MHLRGNTSHCTTLINVASTMNSTRDQQEPYPEHRQGLCTCLCTSRALLHLFLYTYSILGHKTRHRKIFVPASTWTCTVSMTCTHSFNLRKCTNYIDIVGTLLCNKCAQLTNLVPSIRNFDRCCTDLLACRKQHTEKFQPLHDFLCHKYVIGTMPLFSRIVCRGA